MIQAAFWEYVDQKRTVLCWKPVVPLEESTLSLELELAEAEWRLFSLTVDPQLEYVLPGQLLKYRAIKRDEPIAETVIKRDDLGQGLSVPVALAFPPPEHIANVEEGVSHLRTTSGLPPATLGQFGIVFQQRQRWVYPLSCLDEAANDLQGSLADLLHQLSEHDYQQESHRFQQAQIIADQLARRYYAYFLLQAFPVPGKTHAASLELKASGRSRSDRTSPVQMLSDKPLQSTELVLSQKGSFLIPALPQVDGVLRAIYAAQGGQWREQAGMPTYIAQHKRAGRTIIQIRPEDVGDGVPEEQTTQFLWQIVRALSDLDAVVFLALLGIHLATPPDEHGGHWVYVKDLVDMRALRPKFAHAEGKDRRTGFHQDNLERVSAAIDRINMVWLQFLRRGGVDTPLSKLILIDSVYLKRRSWRANHYKSTFSPSSHPASPDAYHIRLGPWLDPFFEKPHFVSIHQGILSFRLHNRFWEERLLTYIDMHASMQHRRVLHCRIRTLFEELSLPRDHRHPWDSRNRFEEALTRLKETQHIHNWQPSGEYPPISKDWFELWLDQFIDIIVRPAVER